MKRKITDIVFIVAMLAVVTVGFVTAITSKKEINKYENRYAERFESFSLKSYMDSSFQDSVEAALSDRVNFAEAMKKLYNDTKGNGLKGLVDLASPVLSTDGECKYVKLGDRNLIGDHVVLNYSIFEDLKWKLMERVEDYNSIYTNNPDVDFYFYYIEKDTDINFETGEKVGVFEYMKENLLFDRDKMARLKVDNFNDFTKYFFRTDHHWNEEGAHIGYSEVLKLLDKNSFPIEHGERIKISDKYRGSKSQGETAGFFEDFWVYEYNLPKIDVYIHAWPQESYGRREEFIENKYKNVTYADYYGLDVGVVKFEANKGDDNVLIIGESYDNAILNLLACHFNTLHSVDLRYYEVYMHKKFDLSDYIAENNINKVLFMGNVDYLILDEFIVEE